MGLRYDTCHTLHRQILLPDVEIKDDAAEYVYVPLRGSPHILAVFDLKDQPIGWIKCETLGYKNVEEWMEKTKWIDQGW